MPLSACQVAASPSSAKVGNTAHVVTSRWTTWAVASCTAAPSAVPSCCDAPNAFPDGPATAPGLLGDTLEFENLLDLALGLFSAVSWLGVEGLRSGGGAKGFR